MSDDRTTLDVAGALASLYAHEISFVLAAEWDVGFYVHLGRVDGDDALAAVPCTACLPTLEGAVAWLVREAVRDYPRSSFAAEWRGRIRRPGTAGTGDSTTTQWGPAARTPAGRPGTVTDPSAPGTTPPR